MPLYLGSKTVSENINMGDTVIQNTFDLFDVKWSDHIINNESWMCADDFNWIDGTVFSAAWNELKSEWDLATVDSTPPETETIGTVTISYWRSPKGYKFVNYGGDTPETNENLLQQLYNEVGIAWYYLIDTTGQIRFKLPRTKYGFVGVRSGAGNFVDESLPNLTGSLIASGTGEVIHSTTKPSGVFTIESTESSKVSYSGSGGNANLYFDASRSSSTYQDGANVQQKSTEMHLYFYLADFVRTPLESNLNTFITETKEALNEKVNASDYSADKTNIENDINTLETTKITQTDLDNTINTQRTNCITKIPQDIKLELNDGTLTLKAGSKVYVPNGPGVFDEIVISSDRSISDKSFSSGVLVIFSSISGASIRAVYTSFCTSGTSAPTDINYRAWYDITNNVVKSYSEGSYIDNMSLPIAVCTYVNNEGFTSIDQVFNGFGYIGSTVFALPGVEGLIPNGRNPDGSLNNTKFTTNSVLLFSPTTGTYNVLLTLTAHRFYWNNSARYDQENNYNLNDVGIMPQLILGYANFISGRITSFSPKPCFHAVDYYDFKQLDENIVHKTGDESIDGIKTYIGSQVIRGDSKVKMSSMGIDLSILPTTTLYNFIDFTDKNNKRIGIVGARFEKQGYYGMYLQAGNEGGISITSNGTSVMTSAPTPPAGSNNTNIATTNWISDPNKSTNVVHRNATEEISGRKTLTTNLIRKLTTVETDTVPAQNQYLDFVSIQDKNGVQVGYFGTADLSSGKRQSRIGVSRRKSDGTFVHSEIGIGTDSAGNIYTTTPTPALNSNSSDIVNTSWFNQKIKVVSTLPASPNANVYYFVTNA